MRHARTRGFTLLEITIAFAVFAVVLGATAQALVSYFVALNIQNQRQIAVRQCTTVLNDMRVVRDAKATSFPFTLSDARVVPQADPSFPASVTAWWPDAVEVPNAGLLPGQRTRVDYADPGANPLSAQVTTTWNDLRGRPISVRVSTILTDR